MKSIKNHRFEIRRFLAILFAEPASAGVVRSIAGRGDGPANIDLDGRAWSGGQSLVKTGLRPPPPAAAVLTRNWLPTPFATRRSTAKSVHRFRPKSPRKPSISDRWLSTNFRLSLTVSGAFGGSLLFQELIRVRCALNHMVPIKPNDAFHLDTEVISLGLKLLVGESSRLCALVMLVSLAWAPVPRWRQARRDRRRAGTGGRSGRASSRLKNARASAAPPWPAARARRGPWG